MAHKEEINHDGQYPSEFKENPHFYVVFATNNLSLGRMIAASKSTYCQEHQGDLIIFNANIITEKHGKVWYGDLNITKDFDILKNIADQLKEDLYILMEGDARFGYENDDMKILMSKARTIIKCKKKKIIKTKTKEDFKNIKINKKEDGINNRST